MMKKLLKRVLSDEAGYVVSAELVLVGTIAVTGLVVGLTEVRNAMVNELADVSESIGSLDQSFRYSGFVGCRAITAGSCYVDHDDDHSEVDFCHVDSNPDRSHHHHDQNPHIDDHRRGKAADDHHHRRFDREGNCEECLESRPRLFDAPHHQKRHSHHGHNEDHDHETVPQEPHQPELPEKIQENEEVNSV